MTDEEIINSMYLYGKGVSTVKEAMQKARKDERERIADYLDKISDEREATLEDVVFLSIISLRIREGKI